MHWIDFILGGLLILTGLFLVILQVAVWLKWVTIPQGGMQLQNIGKWEVLLVLAQKLPPLLSWG